MPTNYDDHNENKAARRHHVVRQELPAEQSGLTQEDSEQVKRLAQELFAKLVEDSMSEREKAHKLWKEPEHPLVAPCQHWLDAIERRDLIDATTACAEVVTLMQTYYIQRPIYKMRFDHLKLAEPLSPDNKCWIVELVALATDKSL